MDFLRAVRSKYEDVTQKESFDPAAAMFVCHRWDKVEEKDKVRDNAVHNLEFVWPGFEPSQLFFFSTKDTQKHLEAGEIDMGFSGFLIDMDINFFHSYKMMLELCNLLFKWHTVMSYTHMSKYKNSTLFTFSSLRWRICHRQLYGITVRLTGTLQQSG